MSQNRSRAVTFGLTRAQYGVLNFVREFTRERGIAPTLQEIARGRGGSKGSVHALVKQLAERGRVVYTPHRSRSIQVIEPDDVTITLSPDMDIALRALAEQRGATREEIVAAAVREFVKSSDPRETDVSERRAIDPVMITRTCCDGA